MDKRLALGIAIIMGVVAILMVNNYVSKTTKEATKGLESISIIVAAKNLQVGTVIKESDLSQRDYPAKYVGDRSIRPDNRSMVIGTKLVNNIEGGKPVLWSDLDIGKREGFSKVIKAGMRTVTIPVSSLTAVSNMVRPGSRVDIFLTFNKAKIEAEEQKEKNKIDTSEIPDAKNIKAFREYLIRKYSTPSKFKQMTILLKQNVLVLATGKNFLGSDTPSDNRSSSYSELTLLVTLVEAQEIIHAMTMGNLTLTLRNDSDVEKLVVPPSSDKTVFYSAVSASIAETDNIKSN